MKDTKITHATVTIAADEPQSDWLEIDEVCKEFRLPKNNIKSKEWRDNNSFPYHQTSKGSKVTFNRKEIEKWVKTR
jgi:hypothetical protein